MSIVLLLLLSGSPQNAPRAMYVITEAGRIQPEAGGSLALLPPGDATIVVRDDAAAIRTLLLPLHSTDLIPLLREDGSAAGLPAGAHFVACGYAAGLCASWPLQSGQSLSLPNRRRVVQDIITAARLTDQVPALLLAKASTRFVVDVLRRQVWFDEIEITDLKAGTRRKRSRKPSKSQGGPSRIRSSRKMAATD